MHEPTHNAPIYLDYNATTPLDPRVFESMKPWFLEEFGNAGSRTHSYGQRAKEAVGFARKQVAELIGAEPTEIIFTSGATESNNLAILGLAQYGIENNRKHIISTSIEHKAVLEPLEYLARQGFEIELAPVAPGGYVESEAISERLRPDTLLVSVMHANNETGVLQPIHEISEMLADTETFFHTDAAQTYGKEVEALEQLDCDFLSISAHKVYGPKGIGALYIRRRHGAKHPLKPLAYGGGQERGLRPGTLPVPLIVGLGKAAQLAGEEYLDHRNSAAQVKEQLLKDLQEVEHHLNGDQSRSQSHVLNVSFPGLDSEALMMAVKDDLAISNGSACTSESYSPSHVLMAMELEESRIEGAVRISWGSGIDNIRFRNIIEILRGLIK